MSRPLFIILIIIVHVSFLFLHIHKTSQFMKQSYRRQRNEQIKITLLQKKQDLTLQLCAIKDRSAIKRYAMDHLGMEKTKLTQIKKLNAHEEQL